MIADNLDRIVPSIQDGGRSNHDEIFIDRSEQLLALNCHMIYTLPISMAYSNRAVDLSNIYDDMQVLPMIMVQQKSGDVYQPGMDKITEIIEKRGNALGNLGRFEEAIASYDEALKFKPDYNRAWNNRGIALGNLGRFEEAIASNNQALKFKPDDHEACQKLFQIGDKILKLIGFKG